jgi:hypothetical protein
MSPKKSSSKPDRHHPQWPAGKTLLAGQMKHISHNGTQLWPCGGRSNQAGAAGNNLFLFHKAMVSQKTAMR